MKNSRVQILLVRIFAVAGLLGGLGFVVMVLYLHVLDGGNWTHRLISEYAYGPHGASYTAALHAHGVGNLALAIAVFLARPRERGIASVAVLYGLAAVGIVVTGFVRTAPPDDQAGWIGNPHQIIVAATMIVQTTALFAFARIAKRLVLPPAYSFFSATLPWLCVLGLVWLTVALFVFNHAGLAERIVIVLFLAWEVWSAGRLATNPRAFQASLPIDDEHLI